MKFLIDAQLPRRMVRWLSAAGHDAIHTLDFPDRNLTTDVQVCRMADSQGRIVVSKDSDFVDSFLIRRQPQMLLLISVGNAKNDELEKILARHLPAIEIAFQQHAFVEITAKAMFVHE